MDKQKQIEETQRLLNKYFRVYGYIQPTEVLELVANDLYENNVCKIPENAVVLTREEYDGKEIVVEMSGGHKLRLSVGKFGEMSKILEEETRKETAEKFAEMLKEKECWFLTNDIEKDHFQEVVDEICKEFTGDKNAKNEQHKTSDFNNEK